METAAIELGPLRNAIARLAEGLDLLAAEPGNALLRDGVIQRFEFTYELSTRTLRRCLEAASANPVEIGSLSFGDLIRVAGERGFLGSSWPQWRAYRQARTDTSHTYDETKAVQVLAIIPGFLEEARNLLTRLEVRDGRG